MLQNNSYLHRRSSVLFAFKICFDQIFVVSLLVMGGFDRRYAKSFLYVATIMISQQAEKNIPICFQILTYLIDRCDVLFHSYLKAGEIFHFVSNLLHVSFIVPSMPTVPSWVYPVFTRRVPCPGGGGDFLIWPISVSAALQGMVFKVLSPKKDIQFLLFWIGCCFKRVWRLAMGSFIQCFILYPSKL